MDQPTDSISSHDPPSRHEGRWFAGLERWCLPQGAVRAVAVVVVNVVGEYLWVPDIRGVGPELRVRDGNQPDRMIGAWLYD
jgi:hypothetical protein